MHEQPEEHEDVEQTVEGREKIARDAAYVMVANHQACRVNSDIDKPASPFVFAPNGCSPGECETVRALILALDNVDPIPDGSVVFTCDIAIAADAEVGAYPLRVVSLGASDPHGNALPVLGRDGTVTVRPPVKQSLHAASDDAGGCAIAPPAAGTEAWWLIALGGLVAVARQQRPQGTLLPRPGQPGRGRA